MPDKLFLLDAFALIFRAHFAFTKNPRINSKGINTSVPFGFTNTLLEVLLKQQPTHVGVAFDTSQPTFRDDMYEAYKANREETPEDIKLGTPIVKDIVKAFGIPIFELDGYEADDVIGTIAKKASKTDLEVYMMTPDKDYGQLVNDRTWLYKPAYMGNAVELMGPEEVCGKWNIKSVDQVIDMLGLQGDTSDNIPGIPGVGPKTAATLLGTYGTIENIIAHKDELKGKLKERVTEHADQALLSKKLATIHTEVPIEVDFEQLKYEGPNESQLRPILEGLEFRTMINRVFPGEGNAQKPVADGPAQLSLYDTGASNKPSKRTYKTLKTDEEITTFVQQALSTTRVALEAVTDEAPHFNATLKGMALATAPGEAVYIPCTSDSVKALEPLLANEAIRKSGYNLKATLLTLRKCGIALKGCYFDALLAHYLVEPEASHDMSLLANQYLNVQMIGSSDVAQMYCERCDILGQLEKPLWDELDQRGHRRLLSDVEMPLMETLADMEYEGVSVNTKVLEDMSKALKSESGTVQKDIYTDAGMEFNIASPKQLGEVLFNQMRLVEKPKKTKTGQYATGEEILLKLADHHPIIGKILTFREIEKLRSTYVDALPKMISAFDGRIHTDYRQAVAATGRLSSNNPNLQNIPIRTERGRQIRDAFIAKQKGHVILSADYSQIELRLAAAFAHDQTMLQAFRDGKDIHTATAAGVFQVALEDVTPDMRRKAKEVNFGILYGSTAFGLAQNLQISRKEAAEMIEAYFSEFSSIKRYMDDAINTAREQGYVETILGRRRYLRDILSNNVATRGFAERNAINAPIQGSAADIIKVAMITIHRWLKKKEMQTQMIMQVHDELIFDVPESELEVVKKTVPELMKTAVCLDVTLEVETGSATSWLGAH